MNYLKYLKYPKDTFLGILASAFGLIIHPVIAGIFAYLAWRYSIYYAAGILPFLIGLYACIRTEWEGIDENGYLRGKLPAWAYAYSTPDEDAPGDVRGEAALKWVYKYLGPTVACIYWHLERNRGMGFSFKIARKSPDLEYLDGKAWGFIEIASGAWRWQRKFFPWFKGEWLSIGIGTQTTMRHGEMWIRPWFGIKVTHSGNP